MRVLGSKTTLDIIVDAQIALNHVCKVAYNLVCILIKQTLQLGHLLVVIEVLFVLGIKLNEDCFKMLQSLNELLGATLLSQI